MKWGDVFTDEQISELIEEAKIFKAISKEESAKKTHNLFWVVYPLTPNSAMGVTEEQLRKDLLNPTWRKWFTSLFWIILCKGRWFISSTFLLLINWK